MPKIKTKRAAAKRFKATANGKFIYHKSGKSHLLTHKSRKRKRWLRKPAVIDESNVKKIRRMLPGT